MSLIVTGKEVEFETSKTPRRNPMKTFKHKAGYDSMAIVVCTILLLLFGTADRTVADEAAPSSPEVFQCAVKIQP